jgi:hypothetical protein
MQNMYYTFLQDSPVKLIVGVKGKDPPTPKHFLDFAFDILKSIKIHAKYTFYITITKSSDNKAIDVNIETIYKPLNNINDTYTVTNPNKIKTSLPDKKNDSYVLESILGMDVSKPFIVEKENENPNEKPNEYIISEDTQNQQNPALLIDTILNKNYNASDTFTKHIQLIYTKPSAKIIIIDSIKITSTQ